MRIAFFGSSLVSAFWNGAATYYRGLLAAMARRGHDITFFEPDAFERQKHRDIPDPDWARVEVYQARNVDDVRRTVQRAAGADLVVKASGVGVFDPELEAEVLRLQSPRSRVVFWDVDAPATLERLAADPGDPFHELIPRYDLVLTYGGGSPVVDAYTGRGARRCVPIYNALDPSTHFPTDRDSRFAGDLGFLGNRLPDREARIGEFFLRAAQRLPERQFVLGGSGWEPSGMPANVRLLGHVFTRDHNAFNCSSTAVLNVNRASMARFGFSPPTRVFEAAGAGACLITDAWPGIEEFLEPDDEVLVAHDGLEVAAHLQALTSRRAAAIGQAARRRILSAHTYQHRAEVLEQVLALPPGPPRPAHSHSATMVPTGASAPA